MSVIGKFLTIEPIVATALLNKGIALGTFGRSAEAIAVYDELLARFGTATQLREQLAKALVNKGNTLRKLNRNAEAIVAYDEVLARFGTATEQPLRKVIAMAKSLKASIQGF
jgi:tetratricopeptide (TPR) repeat protein